MATCRYCGKGGMLRLLDGTGLCSDCQKPVRLMIETAGRVLVESLDLAQNSRSRSTRLKRWDLVIDRAEKLLEFEQRGISTIEPPPSVILREARERRAEAIGEAAAAVSARAYANTTCPYCDAKLDPLPKAKKKCPSCGRPIWVRTGPDDLTYLLQEADLPTFDRAWDEHREAENAKWIAESNALAREDYKRTIVSARELDLPIEYSVADDACPVCRQLAGQVFDPRTAPPLPIAGCQNEFCRCGIVAIAY